MDPISRRQTKWRFLPVGAQSNPYLRHWTFLLICCLLYSVDQGKSYQSLTESSGVRETYGRLKYLQRVVAGKL